MSTAALTHKRELSPDSKGRYRPYIGYRIDDAGQRVPVRFGLGVDRNEAARRYQRLQDLYADDCRTTGQNNWSRRGLQIAQEIASGKSAIQVAPPPAVDTRALPEYQARIAHLQQDFPSVAFKPADVQIYGESAKLNSQYVQQRIAELKAELEAMGALLTGSQLPADKIIAGTLHAALDAYANDYAAKPTNLLEDGDEKPNTFKERERCDRLKTHHADFPLYELGRDKVEAIVDYWRARPKTNRGGRCSHDTAEHHIKQLYRFFRWLDGTKQYEWQLPRGFDSINRKIEKIDSDRKLTAMVKPTYPPATLAKLAETANNFQRMVLYCGLNFGMGAAELGRLEIADFFIREPHPYAQALHMTTSDNDSYLRWFRPKTHVFGEFAIWPETLQMIEWGIKRAKRAGTNLLCCWETGQTFYNTKSTNPASSFGNLWDDLHKQAKIKKEVAFGSIRDTSPDYLRAVDDSELASMWCNHGVPKGVDKLLDCYANRPWGRFHKAVRQAHSYYAPLWAVHKAPT